MRSSILLLNILRVSSLVQTLNIEDIEARPCVKKLSARGFKTKENYKPSPNDKKLSQSLSGGCCLGEVPAIGL